MDLVRKTDFFEGWSWFKFTNLRLVPGIALKFYNSVAKGLILKSGEFVELISMIGEVTGEKGREGGFLQPLF